MAQLSHFHNVFSYLASWADSLLLLLMSFLKNVFSGGFWGLRRRKGRLSQLLNLMSKNFLDISTRRGSKNPKFSIASKLYIIPQRLPFMRRNSSIKEVFSQIPAWTFARLESWKRFSRDSHTSPSSLKCLMRNLFIHPFEPDPSLDFRFESARRKRRRKFLSLNPQIFRLPRLINKSKSN